MSTGEGEVCSVVPGCMGLRVTQASWGGPFGIALEDATRKSMQTSANGAIAYSKVGRGTFCAKKKKWVGLLQIQVRHRKGVMHYVLKELQ